MKVGVLGTGDVGRALGHGFVTLGHRTMLGSRTSDNAAAGRWVAEHRDLGNAGTFAEAASFGEILVFATKGSADVLRAVAEAIGREPLAGKVVIDATNPLDFSRGYPDLAIKGEDSGGETLQRLLPEARIVKAFNTTNYQLMFRPVIAAGPPDMFIAGNDADAKKVVTDILTDFGWPSIDCGPILSARWLEAMCMAWVMASMARGNWRQAFRLLQA